MRTLISRVVVFVIGALIGIGGIASVLYLLNDGMTNMSVQRTSSTHTAESSPLASSHSEERYRTPSITAEIPSRIEDIVFPRRTFDLKAGIVFWVATLTDDQIVDLLKQSTETSWHVSYANRTELQTTLLQKLSTTAPARALDFVLERDEYQRNSMIRTVYAAWARHDLNKAIERAKELDHPDSFYALDAILDARTDLPFERKRDIAIGLRDERHAFYSHFTNLTKDEIENPRETWYEIVNLASRESVQEEAEDALNRVAIVWFQERGLEILDEIVSSISEDFDYYFVLDGLFDDLSADRSQNVFDYMMSNLGDRAIEVIRETRLSEIWARRDPKNMLAKVKTLPASDFREDLIRLSVRRWADRNPQQIFEQLEQVPPGLREYASDRAIDEFTQKSPTEAAQFVLQMSDEEMQEKLATRLIQTWCKEDAASAKEWVLDLPTNDPIRASMISSLKWRLVSTDPRDAFELALKEPIDYGSEDSILDRIADDDVQLALELLPQVREGRKVSAYAHIGSSLVEQGFSTQALDLANDLDQTEQKEFYQRIAMRWAYYDPKGLLKVFDDFPTFAKSRIAVGIKITNEVGNYYSEEELAHVEKHISDKDKELFKQVQNIDIDNASEEELELLHQLHLY
ncbi:MAG: hypothetical protein F4227_09820 [Gammaproteobacteria bacterium]|nr:hypothetical protein [Gammaproteobacteria bacterium]MYF03238.1 hypothetical protein [Gammaproteobacteria bacterium]MYI78000.1 hypothetical protein [Gammaproteobacteria bacterium]